MTVRAKLLLVAVAILTPVAMLGFFTYDALTAQMDASRAVRHALDVVSLARRIDQQLVEMQTGVGAHVLFNDANSVTVTYRWTIGATALGHLLVASAFYGLVPDLPIGVRLAASVLLVVVACTWMVMIFVGAMEDYASVVGAFFVGNVVSVGAAVGLATVWGVGGYLSGFVLGQVATFFVLCARMEREFPARASRQASGLGRSFRRYGELAAAGVLYNSAIAADRVVFWISPEGSPVQSWFYSSLYDPPLFLAYLSVVPSLALFLVSVETDFFDRYRHYYGVVTRHGTLAQVLEAKASMASALRENLRRVLLVQAPISLLLMVTAPGIAELLGLDRVQVAIFRAALVGAALHVLALFGTIILLYFDRRRAAVEVSAVLLAGNLAFSAGTVALGSRFYGLGYPLAALAACLWAYRWLQQTFDDLEYLTFASQPLAPEMPVPPGGDSRTARSGARPGL